MKRNLHSMSLKTLTELAKFKDTYVVANAIGNHVARQNGHGSIKVITHDERQGLEPYNDPHETHRGPAWNQREELRKNMKYLGLVSCRNCATRFSDTGKPLDGKGRVYESYTTREKWCYVCGTRW